MTLLVPNNKEVSILTDYLTPAHTMRLYGNDHTPEGADTVADYTEINGGGYTSKTLAFANYTITPGFPTVAQYNIVQDWTFTGAIDPPATIYGYYVTKDSDGSLLWAERFPSGSVPFEPVNGSIIRVTPRITCDGGG